MVIDINTEGSNTVRRDDIQASLSVPSLKTHHTVHCKAVVRLAFPVRKRDRVLPTVLRDSFSFGDGKSLLAAGGRGFRHIASCSAAGKHCKSNGCSEKGTKERGLEFMHL